MSPKTLGRYFAIRLLAMVTMVYAVCVMLVFFIDFVEMMREGSKVDVSPVHVLMLTLLRLPLFAEMILPFAVLIGGMGTFLMLSRSSELVIVRAAGVSVWQFLRPTLFMAMAIGVFATTVYNPLATQAKAAADRLFADTFAAKRGGQDKTSNAKWIPQNGPDGPSIIYARASADGGETLGGLSVLQFDANKKFIERIEADKAVLRQGYWELDNAHISSYGVAPQVYKKYLISTFLDSKEIKKRVDTVESISFWDLPDFIGFAEKIGISSTAYKLQFQQLLARPFLMVVMVLLAATSALKPFRFGKIQTMVVAGLSAGFTFFILVELSRKLGISGYISAGIAAWAPIAIVSLLALTILLHQEDG